MTTIRVRIPVIILLSVAVLVPVDGSAGITSVTRTGTSTNCAPEIIDPFIDVATAMPWIVSDGFEDQGRYAHQTSGLVTRSTAAMTG